MKIGYACINTILPCTANSTFRLASYSKIYLKEKISQNLDCLKKILTWNIQNKIFFFRIGSSIIPFASHAINKVDWQKEFKKDLDEISKIIHQNKIRITMHPDQFVVLNSPNPKVVKNSIEEIKYHVKFLDALNLDKSAKVVIHAGGVYGDKEEAIKRFTKTYKSLPQKIKDRLILENDDKLYTVSDVLKINEKTKIPICFDIFHHQCHNQNETLNDCFNKIKKTWKKSDGQLILHYSEQKSNAKKGSHSETISKTKFWKTINQLSKRKLLKNPSFLDFDIMLEVKDKEQSVLKVMN